VAEAVRAWVGCLGWKNERGKKKERKEEKSKRNEGGRRRRGSEGRSVLGERNARGVKEVQRGSELREAEDAGLGLVMRFILVLENGRDRGLYPRLFFAKECGKTGKKKNGKRKEDEGGYIRENEKEWGSD